MENKAKRIGDLQIVVNHHRKLNEKETYFFFRLQYPDGREVNFLATRRELDTLAKRASKNPEDCLQPSLIRNILD